MKYLILENFRLYGIYIVSFDGCLSNVVYCVPLPWEENKVVHEGAR